MQVIVKEGGKITKLDTEAGAEVAGTGTLLGSFYKLADGTVVYVPTGETAPTGATPAPGVTPAPGETVYPSTYPRCAPTPGVTAYPTTPPTTYPYPTPTPGVTLTPDTSGFR